MAGVGEAKPELTSDYYRTANLPDRFNDPASLKGYSESGKHPIYQTSSSKYGGTAPSIHTMPNQFHGKSSKFSSHLTKSGMFENKGLNTTMDKKPF